MRLKTREKRTRAGLGDPHLGKEPLAERPRKSRVRFIFNAISPATISYVDQPLEVFRTAAHIDGLGISYKSCRIVWEVKPLPLSYRFRIYANAFYDLSPRSAQVRRFCEEHVERFRKDIIAAVRAPDANPDLVRFVTKYARKLGVKVEI